MRNWRGPSARPHGTCTSGTTPCPNRRTSWKTRAWTSARSCQASRSSFSSGTPRFKTGRPSQPRPRRAETVPGRGRRSAGEPTLPIILEPPDSGAFLDGLLRTQEAWIEVSYQDGRREVRRWDAARMNPSSNVIGNLRSRTGVPGWRMAAERHHRRPGEANAVGGGRDCRGVQLRVLGQHAILGLRRGATPDGQPTPRKDGRHRKDRRPYNPPSRVGQRGACRQTAALLTRMEKKRDCRDQPGGPVHRRRQPLFISAQNAGLPFSLGLVIDRVRQEGTLMSARAYADWSNQHLRPVLSDFRQQAIEQVHLPTTTPGGAADRGR